MALVDLFTPATLAEVKAKIGQFAGLGKLAITLWYSGAPGEQLFQAFAKAATVYVGGNAPIIRGFFLDTATDPGDPDPYNPGNELLDEADGFASALGEQCFFTKRPKKTFANTIVRLTNGSNVAQVLSPGLQTVAVLGHPEITYTNDPDPSFYFEAGGTRTLAAGTYLDVSFTATSPGSVFNAAPHDLSVFVTGWSLVTADNAGAAIGADRMAIEIYRDLCRAQAAATSPNGAPDAYYRLARLNLDGSPLLRPDGAAVGITRVLSLGNGTTGDVLVIYASDSGAADSTDVTTANANITANVIAVPDCITFNGDSATPVTVSVKWAVKYLARYLGRNVSGTEVRAAILAALVARGIAYPISGFDRIAGAGTIYASDIRAVVERAHPAIYSATLSSPAVDVALAFGEVAVISPDLTSTEVSG